jgi:AmiR/NasT family two-component response regulator
VDRVTGSVTPRTFRALVVSSDPLIRDQLDGLIAAVGASLLEAAVGDGLAAARVCAIGRPDAVLLDALEPGGDHDVLGISSASPSTAVIVFTARADRRSTVRMLSAGATAVVAKGDGAVLHDVVSGLVGQRAA